jgi:hypothetical protein
MADHRRAGVTRWIGLGGSSMRPLIPTGATALVDFGDREPGVGSVVLARSGGRFVVHRVVAAPTDRRPGRYILKGDAEAFADPRVHPDDVFGVVRAIRGPDGRLRRAALSGPRAHALGITSRVLGRIMRGSAWFLSPLPSARRRPIVRALASVARAPIVLLAITPRFGGRIAIPSKGGDV